MRYASCCLLSYNRPEFLKTAISSLVQNAGAPLELIVHDDGSTDPAVRTLLDELVRNGDVSTLIANPRGRNQGVGEAVRKSFAAATGDPIVKLDQDLLFCPDWLLNINRILYRNGSSYDEEPTIGALGGFRYPVDPVDHTKMLRRRWVGWEEHEDFVGSLIAVPAAVYRRIGPFPTHSDAFAEDIEFKQKLQQYGYALGLPDCDIVVNQGFGVGPSTVVTAHDGAEGKVQPIEKRPVIFG